MSFLKDLIDHAKAEETIDGDEGNSDAISVLSSQYLRDNTTTWKLYISESKRDRQWIVQEWISATKVWRRGLLLRFFTVWQRYTILTTNAAFMRQNGLLLPVIKIFTVKARAIRKSKDTNVLSVAFSSWRSFVRLQSYITDSGIRQLAQTRYFHLWKEASMISILSYLLADFKVWKLRRTFLRWKTIAMRRFQLISQLTEMHELARIFLLKNYIKKLVLIAQDRQRVSFFALVSTRGRFFLKWKKR